MVVYQTNDVALTFFHGIPAIGPCLNTKAEALVLAKSYLKLIKNLIREQKNHPPCSLAFWQQSDGRYTVIIKGSHMALETICNLDEIMLRRFKKGLKKNLFVLTCFFIDAAGQVNCLALTEGLGAVLYAPG